jgi:hypothetical protein
MFARASRAQKIKSTHANVETPHARYMNTKTQHATLGLVKKNISFENARASVRMRTDAAAME